MPTEFTPFLSLIGGIMIGVSAMWLFLATGRIAGISGVLSRLLPPFDSADKGSQSRIISLAFVGGLLLAAPFSALVTGSWPAQTVSQNTPLLAVAGLLVGFGSVYGNGCTSGHGVCGLGRLSQRSLVGTVMFMATAFLTVLIVRHGATVFGG
ncbi:MAG: YeeE/YedE family protein [Pseudomonadota bacterium]